MSEFGTITKGAEDIDEVVAEIGSATLHIERMNKNEYMVACGDGDKHILLFIGHWPRNPRKRGKLLLNVTENQVNGELRR